LYSPEVVTERKHHNAYVVLTSVYKNKQFPVFCMSVLKCATSVGDNSYVFGMRERWSLISPTHNRKSHKKKIITFLQGITPFLALEYLNIPCGL